MIRLFIGLTVLGIFLIFVGIGGITLASGAQDEPQTITAAELIANGPGDNKHVRVTDLTIWHSYVYEENEGNPGTFLKLWAPAFSDDEPWVEPYRELIDSEQESINDPNTFLPVLFTPPTDFKLIILTDEVRSEQAFTEFFETQEIQGMIVNDTESLSDENLELLREQFPDVEADEVLILDHNREPPSILVTYGALGAGVILVLLGPGLFFFTKRKGKAPSRDNDAIEMTMGPGPDADADTDPVTDADTDTK